jgi:hypothetical protein
MAPVAAPHTPSPSPSVLRPACVSRPAQLSVSPVVLRPRSANLLLYRAPATRPRRLSCSFPNVDSDDFADEAEKDLFYQIAGDFARVMAGEPPLFTGRQQTTRNSSSRGGAGSSRRGAGRGRGGRSSGTAAAGQGQPVPGWVATGQFTQRGQQLYAGTCSSCREPCTVPFKPIQGRSAPCCYSCHHGGGGSDSKQQRDTQAATAAAEAEAAPAAAEAAPADDDHAAKTSGRRRRRRRRTDELWEG